MSIKTFKGILSLNYKTGKIIATKKQARNEGYWIPLSYTINVEIPDIPIGCHIETKIQVTDVKAKEIFIEGL